MKYQFNDGGRAAAGYWGTTGDCVCRAITIGTGQPYQIVYDVLNGMLRPRHMKKGCSARHGIPRTVIHKYLVNKLGWTWTPTMFIGSGCKVHLREEELPKGTIIANVSRHIVCIIDGVLQDINEHVARDGKRCVYGYWSNPA